MRAISSCIITLGCLGLLAPAGTGDREDIQGDWDMEGLAFLRKPNAVNQYDQLRLTLRVTFKGDQLEIRGTGKSGASDLQKVFGADLVRGNCSLNPNTDPKGIIIVRTVSSKGGVSQPVIHQGIYQLKDGKLTLKLAMPGNLIPLKFADQKDAEYISVSGKRAGTGAPASQEQGKGAPPTLPNPQDPIVGKWA